MPRRQNTKVKERKCVFTNLPCELLSSIVSDWLEWTDVGHFDSAVCNKSRKEWLNLLSNNCVFHSIEPGYWGYPPFFHWIVSRGIRARDVYLGMCPLFKDETATLWFQHTGPFLTTLTFHQIKDFVKECIARYCSKLLVLCINDCTLDETCWTLIQNNRNLQQLRMHMSTCPAQFHYFPTDLTLHYLQRLELAGDLFNSVNTIQLLQQLPSLQSIKFDQSYITVANDALTAVQLPNLIHLHIECKYHSISDNYATRFMTLMESLQAGLRVLILPANHSFASVELLSILQYHGHSLRCLCIQDKIDWKVQYQDIDFAEQLNQMPHLHTLSMTYQSLSTLPTPINNLSIKHLYLNASAHRHSIKDAVSGHCPSLCTLSLFLSVSDLFKSTIISDIVLLMELRPLICKLCVNGDEVITGLRKELPHVDVVKYTPIDIFSNDY